MKLLMLQGLPGSGKTHYALTLTSFTRVNKDDIRRELEATGWTWSKENEKKVIAIRDGRIETALASGQDVVSDDTNFGRSHKVRLRELADKYKATFEVKVIDTPIEECILRDSKREGKARVGEEVIRKMAQQYNLLPSSYPNFAKIEHDEHLMKAIICDLDGTLSLMNGRNPYDASACDQDDCHLGIKRLIETYHRFMHYQIIYLSGREDKFRPQTQSFFRKWHCPPGPLFMRPTGDFRKDWIIKGELFDEHVRGKYEVDFVLDDRDQVVKFWRSIELTCLQVAEGAF